MGYGKNMILLRKYVRSILAEDIELCPFPKAIFMAGAPGSGKSTVINKLSLSDRLNVVNADDAYEASLRAAGLPLDRNDLVKKYNSIKSVYLAAVDSGDHELISEVESEYLALRALMSQSMKLFAAARASAKKIQKKYACEKQNFLIDGTAGDFRHVSKQIRQLRDSGYTVAMVYVDVPFKTSVERNATRGSKGGRRLHDDTVKRSWAAVSKNKLSYKDIFGEYFFYIDASEDEFQNSIDAVLPKVNAFLSQG